MDNNTQGTIWNTPAQLTLPDSDYAQPPLHLSFAGRIKASRKASDTARPLDPAERAKPKGADWPRPVWTPVPQAATMRCSTGRPYRVTILFPDMPA